MGRGENARTSQLKHASARTWEHTDVGTHIPVPPLRTCEDRSATVRAAPQRTERLLQRSLPLPPPPPSHALRGRGGHDRRESHCRRQERATGAAGAQEGVTASCGTSWRAQLGRAGRVPPTLALQPQPQPRARAPLPPRCRSQSRCGDGSGLPSLPLPPPRRWTAQRVQRPGATRVPGQHWLMPVWEAHQGCRASPGGW
jgi:hypothetical protein